MRAVAEIDAAHGRQQDTYFDGSPADTLLVGIGEELRSAYADVTSADQPESLVDLAQKLDALMTDGGENR